LSDNVIHWEEGRFVWGGVLWQWWIGWSEKPTKSGLRHGQIQSLQIKCGETWVCSYNKEWIIKPIGREARKVCGFLTKMYRFKKGD